MALSKCCQSSAVVKAAINPQENEAPQHPLQNNSKPGPKGAYEVRRANDGLYIRVDMPGVASLDDVKLNNKSDKHSITFYGKAPMREGWPLDDSQRVYAGSICLDRDPDLIPLEKTFKNGCLRLFLPGADGNLCFLTNQESGRSQNPADEQVHQPGVIIGGLVCVIPHKPDCGCCKGGHSDIQERTCTKEMSFINPSILQGVRGVYETKFLQEKEGDGWGMYFRFDMPDFSTARMCQVKVEKKRCIIFGPMGSKEYPLDQGGRSYFCKLTLCCDCCYFLSEKAVHELKDGVMRMWFTILTKQNNSSSAKRVRNNSRRT
ncbi:hypothetical protein SOVF_128950 [Spinacia oleracea]|nr:hypothetical protein SOVF_128950 [Spinacia oleracea]